MRARTQQWVAVAAVAVVLGSGGLAGCGDKHVKPVARPAPPTIADAHAVALALAKLPEKPEDYVATDVRSAVAPRVAAALPAGSTITANEASWHPDGLDGGTITVTVTAPGAPTTTYTAIMIKEPSGWKVVATIPMTPSTAGNATAAPGAAPAAQVPAPAAVATPSVVTAPTAAPTQSPSPSPNPNPKKSKQKPTPTPTATPGDAQ
jgi:hypothetical protein